MEHAGRPAGAHAAAKALAPLAEVIAVPDGAFDGAALLISVPQSGDIAAITRPGEGRRFGALDGPRRQPRDPLYGRGRRRAAASLLQRGAVELRWVVHE